MGYFDHTYKKGVDQPMGACLIARKEVIDAIGLMDERFRMFFSDVDWCIRCKEKGFKIVFNPDIKVYHILGHSVMKKRVKMILSSHFAFFLYLQKYFKKRHQCFLNYFFGILLFIGAFTRIILLLMKKPMRTFKN